MTARRSRAPQTNSKFSGQFIASERICRLRQWVEETFLRHIFLLLMRALPVKADGRRAVVLKVVHPQIVLPTGLQHHLSGELKELRCPRPVVNDELMIQPNAQ